MKAFPQYLSEGDTIHNPATQVKASLQDMAAELLEAASHDEIRLSHNMLLPHKISQDKVHIPLGA
jgi:hypothetical protein